MPHRIRQVFFYRRTANSDPELPPDALQRLTEPMEHQFRILNPADQTHLLRVYQSLLARGAEDDTITAGLIHDVGKACAKCRITMLDRGLHVVFSRFAAPFYRQFAAIEVAPSLVRGLHRLANHQERGALAASQAGYNERVVYLIRHHEAGGSRHDNQLRLLRDADNEAAQV